MKDSDRSLNNSGQSRRDLAQDPDQKLKDSDWSKNDFHQLVSNWKILIKFFEITVF